MKLKIKTVQNETERLSLFLKYVDVVVNQSNRAIKSRNDLIQFLAAELLSAFNDPDSAMDCLFKDAPEIGELCYKHSAGPI